MAATRDGCEKSVSGVFFFSSRFAREVTKEGEGRRPSRGLSGWSIVASMQGRVDILLAAVRRQPETPDGPGESFWESRGAIG